MGLVGAWEIVAMIQVRGPTPLLYDPLPPVTHRLQGMAGTLEAAVV